jgi:acetylornithine aminotransferase/acetylornithine/N-succinyldiaminopimelate aminotransferase
MAASLSAQALSSDPYPAGLPRRDNAEWRAEYDRFYTPTFGQRRLALVRGKGSRVWDAEGKEYLDFLTGISVNNLGHCHPRITQAIAEQAATLVHCTNLYYIPVQIELARLLIENSFADRVFFGNSGAEANEGAIKLARRWLKEDRGAGHHEIITFQNSFHGRTMATLSATGQEKVKHNFEPLLEGFVHAEFNNLDSVRALISDKTGAIMVEPIQGESGVWPATPEFMTGLRALCDEHGLLLIVDEVQTGLGRAGTLFAYEQYGIQPDIMTLAKSLAGGMAMGAMLCTDRLASAFGPGAHGTTMGGNPLASAAARAYVSELLEGDWPAHARKQGELFRRLFEAEIGDNAAVKAMRIRGLMIGIDVPEKAQAIHLACEQAGLLINATGANILRLLPPLNVSDEDIAEAVKILAEAIRGQI